MLTGIVSILSRIPLRVHYFFADWLLYPVIYHIARYRRKIVAENLRNSFPEKTEAQRKQLEKDFYHQFCDTIVECIYGYHISDEEIHQRMAFENMDEINRLILAAGGGMFMMAHLSNWEWMTSCQQWMPAPITQMNVYRKMKNAAMDKTLLAIRSRHGGVCVDKQRILREMVRFRGANTPVAVGLICDQKPRPEVTRIWLPFLNRETGFLDGGEMLSKKFNYPVFYTYVTRTRRGYYNVQMHVLFAEPRQAAEGEITAAYARILEKNIREQPALWLWTHNRWKWKKSAI